MHIIYSLSEFHACMNSDSDYAQNPRVYSISQMLMDLKVPPALSIRLNYLHARGPNYGFHHSSILLRKDSCVFEIWAPSPLGEKVTAPLGE